MKTISVIGGSGFVGTRLIERLNSNFNVNIIDKNPSAAFPIIYQYSDVRSEEELTETLVAESIVINLAAEHRDDVSPRSLYYEVNVQGAKNICKVASEKKITKIIFTSSVAVYGMAALGVDESGSISPFNEYGRTKWKAEKIYNQWQSEDPEKRTLVIIRPTVIFGERNRGNVFNLLKQISTGKFMMVGNGSNRKSMAYVENVAAFIEHSISFDPGVHIYNYIDKPDFTMSHLVAHVNRLLGREGKISVRLPYLFGLFIGRIFDLAAFLMRRKLPISSIRVKKFCSNSVYSSSVDGTGFKPPFELIDAIEKTVKYEFLECHRNESVFYTE